MTTYFGLLNLSDTQREKYDTFYREHALPCRREKVLKNGEFTVWSSGIGGCITYTCRCGKKIDLTESENW